MPNPIDDEVLVAYLDGELPSDQVVAVEQSLTYDDSLRERLDMLRNTWDLLSELPDVAPRRDLAQSTIEILTLELDKKDKSLWSRISEHPWLTICVASLLMLLCGVVAGRTASKIATKKLLGELPTIVEYRSLANIDSLEWFQRLSTLKNLVEAGAGRGPKRIGETTVPVDIDLRSTWVESLSDTDLGRLEDNLGDFNKEDGSRKQQMRDITDQIFSDETQAEELLQVAHAYYAILDLAGSKQAASLRRLPIDQRLLEVEQRVARVMLTIYAAKMSEADRQAILDWLDRLQWDEENRELFDRSFDADQLVFSELSLDANESIVSDEDTDDLIRNGLSERARELLLSLTNEGERRVCIGIWVLAATRPQGSAPPSVSTERMAERLAQLPNDEKDRLDFMPEEKARAELKKQLGLSDGTGASPP